MMIEVLKSKLHCVRVTEANLNYMGSITIDEDLMDAANMIAGESPPRLIEGGIGLGIVRHVPCRHASEFFQPEVDTCVEPHHHALSFQKRDERQE